MDRDEFELIDPTEWEDFDAVCTTLGHSPGDFDFSERIDPVTGVGPFPETGTLTIKHRRSATQKSYEAGNGSAWVADFHRDLESGVFGTSSRS